MIERSRTPVSASCRVRGIGVAVSVSTCTSARSALSRSLCATPKCCSSSTTTRPRSLNLIALAEQRVRADHDVDRAVGDALLDAAELRRGRPAATPGRCCTGKPRKRSLKVLVCWRASSVVGTTTATCLPFITVIEGRAQRHLGLAEADIAADQPVHRPAGGEIVERRRRSRPAGRRSPRRGSPPRTRRRRAGATVSFGASRSLRSAAILISSWAISRMRFFSRALRRLPAGAAEPVELDAGVLRAVARQQLDILDRQEELGAAGVVDFQAVVRRAGRLDVLQPDEAADAVIDMHHEVAGSTGSSPRR